jgi:archaellum component FlaC
MQGKVDDPQAFCYGPAEEAFRHRDFRRIYDEFVNYYKDHIKGESEYYKWLKALSLDEAREYGAATESFRWAKDMIRYLREDADNKYYEVLIGFPLQSMNGNVYHERDLIAAALNLKGKCPDLNHKDEFWFSPNNPRNRWGNLPVVDAKYEDGAIEAILQVPKDAVCPICDGAKMTDLIDEQRIVNVSLAGKCATTRYGGECEGFQFSDPPFTLLTTDVLPGIPLARIRPLESIMVEALQRPFADETRTQPTRRQTRVKVKMKVQEQATQEHPCPDGEIWDPRQEKCIPEPPAEPSYEQAVSPPDTTPQTGPGQRNLRPKSVEPAEDGSCPDGYIISGRLGKCVLDESCPENQHFDQEQQQCVPDTIPKPKDTGTSMGTPAAPAEAAGDIMVDPQGDTLPQKRDIPQPIEPEERPVPRTTVTQVPHVEPVPDKALSQTPQPPLVPTQKPGTELGEPKEPHTCPDGHHFDLAADMCVPDTALTERVRRFKAEDEARKMKDHLFTEKERLERVQATWEKRYTELDTQFQQLLGGVRQQAKRTSDLESALDKTRTEREDLRVELRQIKGDYADKDRDNKRLENTLEELKIEHEGLKKKYHGIMQSALKLSKDNTKANEDYLAKARECDDLREALKKKDIMAKKGLKIRVKA